MIQTRQRYEIRAFLIELIVFVRTISHGRNCINS